MAIAEWTPTGTASDGATPTPDQPEEPMPATDRAPGPLAAMRCREQGCEAPAAATCAYVDGRGRTCGTHWCLQHLHPVGHGQYCRRHANTMQALGTKAADPRVLPPVDHRGASLVSWVFEEGYPLLNPAVQASSSGEVVVFEDHAVNISRSAQGSRRWERGWRVGDRRGLIRRVVLRVDESDDTMVLLAVDDRVVARGVPPWIGRRQRGESASADGEGPDRRSFYEFLERFLRQALSAPA